VENTGASLGPNAKAEDVAAAWSQITDLTGAKQRNMLQLG
jgi:hypothetical protein